MALTSCDTLKLSVTQRDGSPIDESIFTFDASAQTLVTEALSDESGFGSVRTFPMTLWAEFTDSDAGKEPLRAFTVDVWQSCHEPVLFYGED